MKVEIYGKDLQRTIEGENLYTSLDGDFLTVSKNGIVVLWVKSSEVLGCELSGQEDGRTLVYTEDIVKVYRENEELKRKIASLTLHQKTMRVMDKECADDLPKKRKPFWRR